MQQESLSLWLMVELHKKYLFIVLTLISMLCLWSCDNSPNEAFYKLSYGDTENNIRGNIRLFTETKDYFIHWSSDSKVISNEGIVTRPAIGEENVKVVLTATYNSNVKNFEFLVVSLTGDIIYDEYPSLNDKSHVLEKIFYDELITLLEDDETVLLYFGFKDCPFCKEYLPVYNALVKEKGLGKIYYYDFTEVRKIELDGSTSKLNEKFAKILSYFPSNLLLKHATLDLPWLLAPTFIYYEKGQIRLFSGSIVGHNPNEAPLDEGGKEELITKISDLFVSSN